MKIIDHTPFFNNDTGEIKFLDRLNATMKFGTGWIKEAEAQKQIMTVLGGVLDRSFTLMRNVTPPGLDANFPLILVGPTGVYVMYVTPITGIFRAKGDQWGTISGNSFKNEKPNLLTRTETMARAIQVFLQRQGYTMITSVEAILLCADPSVHVDSIRPIIRVVMRDALERFAVSITQARGILSPESVQDVIRHIMVPPKPVEPKPVEMLDAAGPGMFSAEPEDNTPFPTFDLPEAPTPALSSEPAPLPFSEKEVSSFKDESAPFPSLDMQPLSFGSDAGPLHDPGMQPLSFGNDFSPLPDAGMQPLSFGAEAAPVPDIASPASVGNSSRQKFNQKQWIFLIGMLVIWCLLIAVFIFLVIKDQGSILRSLLP